MKINSRYPLRPVVKVTAEECGDDVQSHDLDLSLTPLIAVIETLKPPVVGQVQIGAVLSRPPASSATIGVSDHFTSLLESLDAITSTLQAVVETQKRPS